MAKRLYKRLGVATVKKLRNQPGKHNDGDGLYLVVPKVVVDGVAHTGAAHWVLRFTAPGGKEREMGLGAERVTSLAEARQRAEAARQLLRDGTDPLEVRRTKQLDSLLKTAKAMTFAQCAKAYWTARSTGWSSLHGKGWIRSLEEHVFPMFGDLSVAAIDTGLVMQALEKMWAENPETASRVRGRIESVLDWAVTREYRPEGANPARWHGHLENLLLKLSTAKAAARKASGRGEHHAALPYAEIGPFMADIRQREGIAARALELLILCVNRTGEATGARWNEINFTDRVWTIPAERMKTRKEHRVPLSEAALTLLLNLYATRNSPFIFPGATPDCHMSDRSMLLLLSRHMGRRDLTVHGFRSTFSDWCAETTDTPSEVRKMAMAHKVGDKVEEAYRRGDLFEKRRKLAEAWGRACDRLPPVESGNNIITLNAR